MIWGKWEHTQVEIFFILAVVVQLYLVRSIHPVETWTQYWKGLKRHHGRRVFEHCARSGTGSVTGWRSFAVSIPAVLANTSVCCRVCSMYLEVIGCCGSPLNQRQLRLVGNIRRVYSRSTYLKSSGTILQGGVCICLLASKFHLIDLWCCSFGNHMQCDLQKSQ